ncbi:hypothetical protein GUJ93_ZPchr0009g1790 [Zizania palustris]|uniref:Uncharacterized protein n=1 Tax=Zizania palustris TaxID=103762 RepID=A0A8J5RMU2_ZIZPA|nr:hypothetical protein GUJ93_ZPchr0009g1790 [Zizania palustris]
MVEGVSEIFVNSTGFKIKWVPELDGVSNLNPKPDDLKVFMDKQGFAGDVKGGNRENVEKQESSSSSLVKKDGGSQSDRKCKDVVEKALESEGESDDDVLSRIPAQYFNPVGQNVGLCGDMKVERNMVISNFGSGAGCYNSFAPLDDAEGGVEGNAIDGQLVQIPEEKAMNPSGLISVSAKDKGWQTIAPVLDPVDDVCGMDGSKIDNGGLGFTEDVAASDMRGKLKKSEKPDEHFGEIKVKGKKKKAPAVALRQSARIKRDGVPIQMKAQLRADLKNDTTGGSIIKEMYEHVTTCTDEDDR